MTRVDRSKRFQLTEATPVEQRPQIWVEGRQQPRFRIGPFVTVSLAIARRDLVPDMLATETRLRGFGDRVRQGELRPNLAWAGRFARALPHHETVAGWVMAVADVYAEARARLQGHNPPTPGDEDGIAYPDLIRGAGDTPALAEAKARTRARPQPVRPRRAAEAPAKTASPEQGAAQPAQAAAPAEAVSATMSQAEILTFPTAHAAPDPDQTPQPAERAAQGEEDTAAAEAPLFPEPDFLAETFLTMGAAPAEMLGKTAPAAASPEAPEAGVDDHSMEALAPSQPAAPPSVAPLPQDDFLSFESAFLGAVAPIGDAGVSATAEPSAESPALATTAEPQADDPAESSAAPKRAKVKGQPRAARRPMAAMAHTGDAVLRESSEARARRRYLADAPLSLMAGEGDHDPAPSVSEVLATVFAAPPAATREAAAEPADAAVPVEMSLETSPAALTEQAPSEADTAQPAPVALLPDAEPEPAALAPATKVLLPLAEDTLAAPFRAPALSEATAPKAEALPEPVLAALAIQDSPPEATAPLTEPSPEPDLAAFAAVAALVAVPEAAAPEAEMLPDPILAALAPQDPAPEASPPLTEVAPELAAALTAAPQAAAAPDVSPELAIRGLFADLAGPVDALSPDAETAAPPAPPAQDPDLTAIRSAIGDLIDIAIPAPAASVAPPPPPAADPAPVKTRRAKAAAAPDLDVGGSPEVLARDQTALARMMSGFAELHDPEAEAEAAGQAGPWGSARPRNLPVPAAYSLPARRPSAVVRLGGKVSRGTGWALRGTGRGVSRAGFATGRGLARTTGFLARALLRTGAAILAAALPLLRPLGAWAARSAHGAAVWTLMILLMIFAAPGGAIKAMVYYLDGGDLTDWS